MWMKGQSSGNKSKDKLYKKIEPKSDNFTYNWILPVEIPSDVLESDAFAAIDEVGVVKYVVVGFCFSKSVIK